MHDHYVTHLWTNEIKTLTWSVAAIPASTEKITCTLHKSAKRFVQKSAHSFSVYASVDQINIENNPYNLIS